VDGAAGPGGMEARLQKGFLHADVLGVEFEVVVVVAGEVMAS
jgi:hypothetical protein